MNNVVYSQGVTMNDATVKTDTSNLMLVKPTHTLAVEFLAMAYECLRRDKEQFLAATLNIHDYFRRLYCVENGIGLGPDQVSASTWWLVEDNWYVIGQSTLRHGLNDELIYQGGHIDVVVRPSMRRQGYGAELMTRTLEHARRRNMKNVLLTCDAGDTPAQRLIEKLGGRLENKVIARNAETLIARYWLEL